MNKHIDAEKLKELIEEKWKELADKNVKVGGGKWDAEISTYLSVLRLIDSLQQEQPNKESLNKAIDSDELDSQQEQQEVNIEKEIEEHVEGMPMSEFTHESEVDTHYGWARKEFRYFFELGQREMRHRIMNPEYNTKVIERLKSEYPTIKEA